MNITLAEDHSGSLGPEKSFTQASVIIGRDEGCDIAFDKARFPMVSRRHAEIRFHAGEWMIADLGSSFGTYLNGRKMERAMPLPVGSAIQLGMDGPIIKVVWFDVDNGGAGVPSPPAASQPNSAVRPPVPDVPPAPAVPKLPAATLIFQGGAPRPPVAVTGRDVWLGRDPSCEVLIEEGAGMVSRRHAEIRPGDSGYFITDNNSFNGTLVNGQRITAATELYNADEIQLGMGGPVLKFNAPGLARPVSEEGPASEISQKTIVARLDASGLRTARDTAGEPQLLMTVPFTGSGILTVGRSEKCEISLDGLQISNRHARFTQSGAEVLVEDLGSTNGIFINGNRVSRSVIGPADSVQIGAFLLRLDPSGAIAVFDTRSKTRVDAVRLTSEVKIRGGRLKLLDDISLSIAPNEFVGLIGPSGAGKSSLIEALNGVRPAGAGNVLVNNLDLYRHFDSLKQAIGYVPQDDIIHRELTVYRTLYYVAKLRLSRDVSRVEITKIIDEVLDVTGLTERKNVPVNRLSGGQRKRVSIAVELITKPSVIYLDEPTSGLDPVTEDRIMRLFKQIAESGRTVIMTTHAMENVSLFDKIVILMRGKLVYYGPPSDALKHFGAENFTQLFKKLEEPVEKGVAEHGEPARAKVVESIAEDWKKRFRATSEQRELIERPLKELGELKHSGLQKRRRLGIFGAIRQWSTLSQRYFQVLLRDKLNLFILLAQAPAIALLTFLVMGDDKPRDFVYFVVALVAVWFGTTVAAREIVRERPVYKRERMFNLGILPYVGSKLFVLSFIVAIQCLLLFLPLKFFDLTGLMAMPGEYGGIAQLWAMLLTAGVGVALGLLISALVRTSEMATSLVPLLLIPQILFSGLVGVPTGINKVVGLTMPSAWSFDTMKRFSTLDTLEPEGADSNGPTKGLGLYRFIENENERILKRAQRDLEDYKRMGGSQMQDPETGEDRLAVPEVKKIPEDLSGYVTFLHPWMNEVLNQLVLMLMFGMLVLAILIVLKIKDRV